MSDSVFLAFWKGHSHGSVEDGLEGAGVEEGTFSQQETPQTAGEWSRGRSSGNGETLPKY